MSRQLSLSSAFCAFAMALFLLGARAGVAVDANGTTTTVAAPIASFEISR